MPRMLPVKSRGGRGIAAIMLGTALGQVIAFGASPVLSRLYSPEDFGVFSVINALAMLLGTGMALRYELAVPLPREDHDARTLVVLGGVVTASTTILSIAVIAIFSGMIDQIVTDTRLRPWVITVPLIAASLATFRILNQWALRQQRYAATARRNVVQSVSTVAIQLCVGMGLIGPAGLIAGLAGGQAVGAASLIHGAGLRGHSSWADLRRLARRYRRFPMLLAPSGILNAAGVYVPVILFATLYTSQVAGWFGFTQRMLALPITLVGQAVAQVYLSELAQSRRRGGGGRQLALFRAASARLMIVGGAGALCLILLARPVFPLVFGEAWRESGAMAQALAVSLALQFVASPLSQTLIVYERTVLQFVWDTSRLLLATAAVVVPASVGTSPLATVWCLSIVSALCYAWSWILSSRTIRRADTLAPSAPLESTA